MKFLSVSVFGIIRLIDRQKGHKLTIEQWNKVHKKTKKWLADRELIGHTPRGLTFLTPRGEELRRCAEFVNFWAKVSG